MAQLLQIMLFLYAMYFIYMYIIFDIFMFLIFQLIAYYQEDIILLQVYCVLY